MFHVEMYFRVRRACLVEGMRVREASRVFDLHQDTVRKMLANATLQGYTRQSLPRRPKLEPYTGIIDAILEADAKVPRKQRHTARRIFERLRDEYGFEGQHTIVKDYVREHRRRVREMFVPLTHGPGHAQCDFGEAIAVIAPAMVATTVMIKVSRLPTWAISWAMTPASSSRVRMSRMPVVTATVAFCGLRPVAKALGEGSSIRTPWAWACWRGAPDRPPVDTARGHHQR